MLKPNISAKSITSRASSVPQWVKTDEIREKAQGELQERSKVLASVPEEEKDYVSTYKCPGCHLQYTANEIQAQIRKAAREKTAVIECPKCAASLQETIPIVLKKTAKLKSTAKAPEVGNSARVINTWIDKANYGHMIEALGRYLSSLGISDPQLKFQRGIRSGAFPGQNITAKAAEFTVEYIDNANTRNRFVIQAGLTDSGHLVTPRTFRMLSGKEYPLTKEAIAMLSEGKMFEPAHSNYNIKPLTYRPVDPTQWRVISADKEGKIVKTANEDLIRQHVQQYMAAGMQPEDAAAQAYKDVMGVSGDPTAMNGQASPSMTPVTPTGQGGGGFMSGVGTGAYAAKTANDPLMDAINQGLSFEEAFNDVQAKTGKMITLADWNSAIDMLTNQSAQPQVQQLLQASKKSFLESRKVTADTIASQYQLPDLSEDEKKIWVNAYVESYNDAILKEVGNLTAIRIAQLSAAGAVRQYQVKVALRDEKTYAPIVDPNPDYSLAAQTELAEKDFGKYEDGDAGILPMEERDYTTMFRGKDATKSLTLRKEAEATGVDLDKEEVGQNPINYSRYKTIIQDLVRAGNIPPHSVDLHKLKDGLYSLDELKKIVDTFKTDKSTFYPTTHASDEGMKKVAAEEVTSSLEAALQKELKGIQVPPNFPVSLEEVQAAPKTITAAAPEDDQNLPEKSVDFNVLESQPRLVHPAPEDVVVEAPPEVAELMESMRIAKNNIEKVQLRIATLKASFAQKLDPLKNELGELGMQQQSAANQIVAKMDELDLRLVQAGNEIGFYTTHPSAQLKLSDAAKVQLLLQVFGQQAQAILDEAERKKNEILRINSQITQQYQQWPAKRRGADVVEYLKGLYQGLFGDLMQLDSLTAQLETSLIGS